MSNMVGIGPFIAIPIILSTLGGPHSYLAWLVGVTIALADGLVVRFRRAVGLKHRLDAAKLDVLKLAGDDLLRRCGRPRRGGDGR